MAEEIQLKFHEDAEKKKLHEQLEEHHKKLEGIKKDAELLFRNETFRSGEFQGLTKREVEIKVSSETDVIRVHTGIEGFDELIEGGIPEKSVVLLTGMTGTGKSIFAMEFLIDGALHNEPGVYISLQESLEETMNQMRFFGWPVDKLAEEGKLLIVQPELYNFDGLLTTIEDSIDRVGAKRLVIDSISIIGMYFEEPFKIRKSLLDLGQMLKKLGCTTLAISEVGEGEVELSAYGVEEYVSDGVVVLYYIKKGGMFLRAVTIRKLRSTRHSTKIHPIEIKRPGGIVVYPSEEVFSEAG
ncbi:MAG: ATPase [Candidatus Aenigmarchaeota archaeon]|nr:ATPase [Candidatus Aenigmarchaeota archaeon]